MAETISTLAAGFSVVSAASTQAAVDIEAVLKELDSLKEITGSSPGECRKQRS